MPKKAVVLLSGGIDSSTTLAIAKSEGYECNALSFDYGQRHKRELESARMVAESLGAANHLVMKFDLRQVGGSALTSDTEVPKALTRRRGDAETRRKKDRRFPVSPFRRVSVSEKIPVTYVPARNTIFLSFALAWAEVLAAEDIFIGANAVDYSGYPDCRPEYLKAFEDMANLATKVSVEGRIRFRIKAPLLMMTKGEIIKKGTDLGLDHSLTWSCYDPQPAYAGVKSLKFKVQSGDVTGDELKKKPIHDSRFTIHDFVPCRKCDSCLFREKGFEEAGIQDPLLRKILRLVQSRKARKGKATAIIPKINHGCTRMFKD